MSLARVPVAVVRHGPPSCGLGTAATPKLDALGHFHDPRFGHIHDVRLRHLYGSQGLERHRLIGWTFLGLGHYEPRCRVTSLVVPSR